MVRAAQRKSGLTEQDRVFAELFLHLPGYDEVARNAFPASCVSMVTRPASPGGGPRDHRKEHPLQRMTFMAALLAGTSLYVTAGMAQQNPAPAAPQAAQEPATLGEKAGRILDTITGKPQANADTDMRRVLDSLADLKPESIETLSAVDARKQPSATDAVKALLRKEGKSDAPEPGVATKDIVVRGAAGELKARTYMPEGAGGAGNLPVVVYFHGGGFVIADLDTYDAGPRAIARQRQCPRGLGAIIARLRRTSSRPPTRTRSRPTAGSWRMPATLGGNPQQVAVMGESAGGNLAINVAMAARDQNFQPPVHEVLVYPAGRQRHEYRRTYQENANAKPLNKPMIGVVRRRS